jgi:predicted  nucleic acid-binding Zn-ribbon protein
MREVHRLRRFARDLREELDRIPRQLKAQQARVTREEAVLKEAHDRIKSLKVAAHEKEVSLRTAFNKVAKHAKQLEEASASKEYEALQKEITTEKAEASRLEDEILATLGESEEITARLPALDAAVQKAREDYSNYEKGISERQAGLNSELATTNERLKQVEAEIPEKYRGQYNRLIATMGADALAVVQGHTCDACHTEITVQSFHELQQNLFVACKSCYRILYMPDA